MLNDCCKSGQCCLAAIGDGYLPVQNLHWRGAWCHVIFYWKVEYSLCSGSTHEMQANGAGNGDLHISYV